MIAHLGLLAIVIILYETFNFINLKNLINKNINILKKLYQLISYKKVSDIWKEKILLGYSKFIFLSSLKIILILIIILFTIFLINSIDENFYNLILSFSGFIKATIIFVIYTYLRKIINGKL